MSLISNTVAPLWDATAEGKTHIDEPGIVVNDRLMFP
jgi:hypothetical protein